MKLLMLRLLVAITAFGFGLAVDRVLVSRISSEPQQQQPFIATGAFEAPTIPVPEPAPTPRFGIFDFDLEKFDPTGDYYFAGKEPKGFDDFNSVHLWWTHNYKSDVMMLHASLDQTYDVQTAFFSLVTRRRVLFVTRPATDDDFGYMFEGQFLHSNLTPFVNTPTPVLSGTLTKIKHGEKVAEAVVAFRIERHVGC